MRENHSSVHNTEINRIQNGDEGGWEFVCHSCGYRARYTIDTRGIQKLEILFVGDESARHTAGPAVNPEQDSEFTPWMAGPLDDLDLERDGFKPEDEWLPEHIVEQVEAIINKLDF